MKSLLMFTLFLPLFSWAQSQSTTKGGYSLNAYQLVKAFDADVAQKMPRSLKIVKIKNLKIHKDSLSFYIHGARFVLTLLTEKECVLRLNGQLFSNQEIATVLKARRSLDKKFGFSSRKLSWLSYLIQEAWADTALDPTANENNKTEKETTADASIKTAAPVEQAFHSYQFVPQENPIDTFHSTSVSELPQLIGKSNTRDALSIVGSLLSAVGQFSRTNSGLNQALDLGVPSHNLPVAPSFSTSSRAVR